MYSQHRHPSTTLAGLLAIVLGLHFVITLIYLMPLNPIKLRLAPLITGYMQPFFAQDWRFFAPEPISQRFGCGASGYSIPALDRSADTTPLRRASGSSAWVPLSLSSQNDMGYSSVRSYRHPGAAVAKNLHPRRRATPTPRSPRAGCPDCPSDGRRRTDRRPQRRRV